MSFISKAYLLVALLASSRGVAQNVSATWGANSNTAWYTAGNWVGGSYAGVQGAASSNNYIATFTSAYTGTTPGINMNTASLNLGAVSVDNTRTTPLNIGNSSVTGGVLRLYGANVSAANQVVRNNGTGLTTLQATQAGTMGVVLGNATDNIFQIDNSGGITVSSVISELAAGNKLTRSGTGTGVLELLGQNTYTGLTTVNGGTLRLNRTGGTTIPATNDVTVNNGATLRVSTNQTLNNVTIAAGGTLAVDAGVTLTINGTYSVSSNTSGNSGTIVMGAGSTLLINQGGWPGNTGTFTYNVTATLEFANTSGSYGVGATDTWWPAVNGPANVNVSGAGGITMNISRTIPAGGLMQTSSTTTISAGQTLTVNGSFRINQGGWGGSTGTYSYGATGTLIFNNSSGPYNINATDVWWPASNGPYNVTVQNGGGINMNVARTVPTTGTSGTFLLVTGANAVQGTALTLNGTVQINGGNFQTTPLYGSASTLIYNTTYTTFNEWTAGGTTMVAAGTGIPANVTIQSGSVSLSGNRGVPGAVSVSGGATLNLNAGDIYLGGNLSNSGTFTHNNKAVFFVGSSQSVTGTFNNTGGVSNGFSYILLYNGTNVNLGAGAYVSNNINFNSGKITLGANDLTMASGATFIGQSAANYIVTNSAGQLKQVVAAAARIFPVGNAAYNPITLTNSGTSDNYGINEIDGNVPNANDITYTVNRRWQVTEAVAGGGNLTVVAQYNAGEEGSNYNSGTQPYVGIYTAGLWTQSTAALGGSITATSNSSFTNTISGTSYFAIGKDNGLSIPAAPPTISGFTVSAPGSGTSGYVGNTITINGTNFLSSGMTVKVGGSGGTTVGSYTFVSNTQITIAAIGASGTIYIDNGNAPAATSLSSYTNLGYITTATGTWQTAATWLGGAVPPSANTSDITIAHNVTGTGANTLTRQITVNTGITLTNTAGITLDVNGASTNSGTITNNGTFSVTGITYTNSGTFTIGNGGNFQINQGGFITGNALTFNATASTLSFNNSSGQYGVANTHVYWPAANGPVSVSVAGAGGVQLQTGASRTITNLTLAAAFDIQSASLLTVNGNLQINSGGSISSNAPVYGNSSTLIYNTAAYNTGTEWSAGIASGAGVPRHVQIGNGVNTALSFTGAAYRQALGNITISASSNLILSASSGGDLQVAGNLTNNGTFTHNNRGITFNGTAAQTISGTFNNGTAATNILTYVTIANTSADVTAAVALNIGGILSINNGARLDMGTNTLVLNAGLTSLILGFLRSAGTITTNGVLTFGNTGTYEHNYTTTAGTIPTATWNSGSTCLVMGYTTNSNNTLGVGQSFSNFSWNCPSQTGNINLAGGLTTINGNLTVTTTNTGSLRLTGGTGLTLAVGGNLSMAAGTLMFSAGTATPVINVAGNLVQSGGIIEYGNSSGYGIINLTGNLQKSAGTIQYLGSNAINGQLNFSGTTQSFQAPGTNQYVDFNITSGSTTTLASNVSLYAASTYTASVNVLSGGILVCPATFTITDNASTGTSITNVQSGGTIQIGSTAGIASSGVTGNVQTITRTFNTAANYIYSGSAAQITGTGLPATVNNLTINNATGVTLSAATTVNGTLTLTSGLLTLGANNLTIAASAGISGGSAAAYVKTNSTGYLRRTIGTSILFPVGNSAHNPITITNSGTSDIYGIRVIDAVSSPLPNDGTKLVNRYWGIVEAVAGGSTLSAAAQYNAGEPNANFAAGTAPKMGLYTGGLWTEQTATAAGTGPFSYSSNASFSPASITTEATIGIGKDDGFLGASNIAISSTNPAVTAGNIVQNTTNNVIYKLQLDITAGSTTLTGLGVTTAGSYISADVTNLKCYYSTSASFAVGTSTLLSTLTTPGTAGAKTFPSFTTQAILIGAAYLYITADLPCTATVGNTLSLNAITTANLTFANGTKSGTANNGGTQTIIAATPVNVTAPATVTGNGQLTISWTLPTGCYEEIMVVATDNSGGVTTVPTGNGSLYTANALYNDGTNDANLNANEFAIYKGAGTSVVMTGLINGTLYNIKIFTRNGSNWSSGATTSGTPTAISAGSYRSIVNGIWTATSTWEEFNGSTWVAATSYPNSTTADVLIQTGTTVTVNGTGPYALKNLTVNTGGKVYTNNTSTATNIYLSIHGNITCNGTIGNDPTYDALGINIEAASCTISGTGTMTVTRLRKNTNANAVTNVTIDMNLKTLWAGTAIYNNNNNTTAFNITINAGRTVNVSNGGSVSIHGTNGTGIGNHYGTYTINGTLTVATGILYLTNSNGNILYPATINIGATGIINTAQISAGASGASGSKFSIASGGLLNITGTGAFIAFSTTNNTYTINPGATVEYSAAGAQTVESALSYSNLTISGSGTKTANGNTSVGSTLKLSSGSYGQTGLTTTIAASGTVTGNGGDFASGTAGGTVSFAGTGTINGTTAMNFYNLNINAGTVSATLSNCTATNLNLLGGTFNVGAGNIFNIANGGTVVATSGDFASGTSAGILNFKGTGTFSGNSNPYDVYLSGGVNFGVGTVTIQSGGSLRVNSGGFVNTNGPFYTNGSTLVYNTGNTFVAGTEWYALFTTGRGVPYDVQVGVSGTNNTVLDFGTSASWRYCRNNVSIGNSSANTGFGFILSTVSGGDLKLAGNWLRYTNGSFTPNNRAVFFVGSGNTQTITANSLSETFAYFIVDKNSGNVQLSNSPATSVTVNGSLGGNVLQLVQGDINLNGQTFNLGGAGGFFNVVGALRQVYSATAATFNVIGYKEITSTSSGTLRFDDQTTVVISNGLNFGASVTTVNATLRIDAGGYADINAPIYGPNGILVYNTGGSYDRRVEWSGVVSGGPGYPNDVIIQNNSTLNAGGPGGTFTATVYGANRDVTISSGSAMLMNGFNMTVPLQVGRDLIINGTLTGSGAIGGDIYVTRNWTRNAGGTYTHNSRAVRFTDASNSTITAPAGGETFGYLRIYKTSSSYIVTCSCPVSVANDLDLNTGIVNTDATNLLTMTATNAASLAGGSVSSYINGPIKRATAFADPSTTVYNANAEYIFPVGKGTAGNYRPCSVYPTALLSGAESFQAEYFPTVYSTIYLGNLVGGRRDEYWKIDKVTSVDANSEARIKLNYITSNNTADWQPSVLPLPWHNMVVAHAQNNGSAWYDAGFPRSILTYSTQPPFIEARGWQDAAGVLWSVPLKSFSPFGFGYNTNLILPLPVQLISFTGALQNNNGLLNWQVADSRELAGFELQYSRDGRSFYKLSDIAPDPGNQYNYLHQQLVSGANFYRLKLVEKNGNTGYSNVVLLTFGKLLTQFVGLRENPVRNNLGVVIVSASRQNARAVVGDALGRVVYRTDTQLHSGQNQWNLASHMLAKGIYFIQLQTEDGEKVTLRFMKE